MNAAGAAQLGAALVVSTDATVPDVRGAITSALHSRDIAAAAGRMASTITSYQRGALAIATLEERIS